MQWAAARRCLAAGSNVIVDRTNFDAQQRGDFVELARSVGSKVCAATCAPCPILNSIIASCVRLRQHANPVCAQVQVTGPATHCCSSVVMSQPTPRSQAHALVLKLPEALCVERAVRRVNHEGGVEGPNAPAIVRRMNANIARAGLPSLAEGIESVSARSMLTCHAGLPSCTVRVPGIL